jgi:hypothetical protein
MRPDMDELDVERMEQRLRRAAMGHRPVAPAALGDFVDSVPGRYRPASRLQLILERPRLRRSAFAAAAAAAVVIAVVVGAAFVSFRQPSGPAASPTPAGTVSDGWAWQATDGTLYYAEMEVPSGFIATCGRNSGQEIVDQTLCSSPDGLRWSVPADPAIVSSKGADPFLPDTILVRKGIYLATSSRGSGEFKGPGRTLWRSTDGVHWGEVDTSKSLGATAAVSLMVVVPDGFLAVVSTNQAVSPPEQGLFISSDGLAWAKASDLPFETGAAGSGYYLGPTLTAGLYTAAQSPDGNRTGTWRTTDGRTWVVVTLPAGYSELGSVVTLPDGSLRGVASSFDTPPPHVVVRSADGLSWQIDRTAPTGSVDALVVVGDRMVAYVSAVAYTDPHQVLQSDDWGTTWRPLLDLSGQPVVGGIGTLGGRLEVKGTDLSAHWLLTPVERRAATPEPSASPAESPSAGGPSSPLESPSAGPSSSAAPSDLPSPSAEAPAESPSAPPNPTPESTATSSP